MENYANDNNEQPSGGTKPERPGGELKGKPVQDPDGKWHDLYGKEISAQEAIDQTYAVEFWKNNPQGVRDVFAERIQEAEQRGTISVFVDKDGINEKDKEKLSAIRQLARGLGYEMGQWKRSQTGTGTATATIKKV